MFFGAFGYKGTLELIRINGNLDSDKYQNFLENNVFNNGHTKVVGGRNRFIFQQDNASPHTSKSTDSYFEGKNVDVLNWPSKSPDLNPIENLWGYLTKRVYSNGRQFNSVDDLEKTIYHEWNSIDPQYLRNLIDGMSNRICQVLINRGDFIK